MFIHSFIINHVSIQQLFTVHLVHARYWLGQENVIMRKKQCLPFGAYSIVREKYASNNCTVSTKVEKRRGIPYQRVCSERSDLSRRDKEGFPGKWCLKGTWRMRLAYLVQGERRTFQKDGSASSKALRWEGARVYQKLSKGQCGSEWGVNKWRWVWEGREYCTGYAGSGRHCREFLLHLSPYSYRVSRGDSHRVSRASLKNECLWICVLNAIDFHFSRTSLAAV